MGERAKKENGRKGSPVKRTVAGSILGATVGYFATPENGKKLIARVDKEALKKSGSKLGTAAKGKLVSLKDSGKERSKRAVDSLKTSASNLLKSDEESSESETEVSATMDETYEDLKEENEELLQRLKLLEEKMDQLIEMGSEDEEDEDNEDEEKDKDESSSKKKSKKKTASKKKSDDSDDDEDESDNKKSAKSSKSKSKSKKSEDEDEGETGLSSDDDTT